MIIRIDKWKRRKKSKIIKNQNMESTKTFSFCCAAWFAEVVA